MYRGNLMREKSLGLDGIIGNGRISGQRKSEPHGRLRVSMNEAGRSSQHQ